MRCNDDNNDDDYYMQRPRRPTKSSSIPRQRNKTKFFNSVNNFSSHKSYYNVNSAPSSPCPPLNTSSGNTSPFKVTLQKSPGPSSYSEISAGQSSIFSQIELQNTGGIDKLINNGDNNNNNHRIRNKKGM